MANQNIEQHFKAILGGIGDSLRAYGFTKRANAYRHVGSGNAAIVEVQRSQASSGEIIRFTLNLGVVSGTLLDEHDPDISKVGLLHAHLRERIGAFLPERPDNWWDLRSTSDPDGLVAEIAPLLNLGARFLLDHMGDAQLTALWETGQSPGLTDLQRQRYLRDLKAA